MKSNKIITANDWRSIHPQFLPPQPSDMYYAGMCTKLLKKINTVLRNYDVDTPGSEDLALLLGFYIEDLVSGTHVFDSFRNMHMKMYGRKLPFYDLSPEYDDEDVNIEDIKFMIWDYVQYVRGDGAIINPDNAGIEGIAHALFPVLCDVYEEAPASIGLHDTIFDPTNYTDFIQSKKILFWLILNNPMTGTYEISEKIEENINRLLDINENIEPSLAFYFIVSQHIFTTPCQWLAVHAYLWLSEMLTIEGMADEAKKMANCRDTGIRTFIRESVNNNEMVLIDKADGNKYRVTLSSFNGEVINNPTTIVTDLATVDGNVWESNGMSWFGEGDRDDTDMVVDGKIAYDFYINIFGGRIAYFKDLEDLKSKVAGDKTFNVPEEIRRRLNSDTGITVFVNSNGSLSVSSLITSTTPDPANPYFRKIDNSILLGSALNGTLASSEMAQYYHDKGWYDSVALTSALSPQRGHDLFHDNFGFLLRYFRGSGFHMS